MPNATPSGGKHSSPDNNEASAKPLSAGGCCP